MLDYINEKVKELKSTFDDFPVILVEVFSANPELKGKIFAITEETAGFTDFKDAINAYQLKQDKTMSIGVTKQCITEMQRLQQQQARKSANRQNNQNEFVEQNFGCLLSLFLAFVAFIFICIFWGGL